MLIRGVSVVLSSTRPKEGAANEMSNRTGGTRCGCPSKYE